MVSFMAWLLEPPQEELVVPIGYEAGVAIKLV
jgi:hypothetical protein